ncbi:MAG: sigma-70 family RNA polymerase sigma factor [Chthonomonas sp.]|nr:sigma-70 family RNA polymerase sigma factor [Chthonomonas sp.]
MSSNAITTTTLTPREEADFRELMSATYKKVYNLAFRLSGDRSDAEDLTQEAFFRAYRGFTGYQGDRPFENWIFRIVTRLFLDMKRARKRRVMTHSYDAPILADGADDMVMAQAADDGPNPEESLLSRHFSEDLEAALKQLKPDQRALIMLADVEQVPYDDIAVMFDIPVGTVRSRLHRTHRRLQQLLEAPKPKVSLGEVVQNLKPRRTQMSS